MFSNHPCDPETTKSQPGSRKWTSDSVAVPIRRSTCRESNKRLTRLSERRSILTCSPKCVPSVGTAAIQSLPVLIFPDQNPEADGSDSVSSELEDGLEIETDPLEYQTSRVSPWARSGRWLSSSPPISECRFRKTGQADHKLTGSGYVGLDWNGDDSVSIDLAEDDDETRNRLIFDTSPEGDRNFDSGNDDRISPEYVREETRRLKGFRKRTAVGYLHSKDVREADVSGEDETNETGESQKRKNGHQINRQDRAITDNDDQTNIKYQRHCSSLVDDFSTAAATGEGRSSNNSSCGYLNREDEVIMAAEKVQVDIHNVININRSKEGVSGQFSTLNNNFRRHLSERSTNAISKRKDTFTPESSTVRPWAALSSSQSPLQENVIDNMENVDGSSLRHRPLLRKWQGHGTANDSSCSMARVASCSVSQDELCSRTELTSNSVDVHREQTVHVIGRRQNSINYKWRVLIYGSLLLGSSVMNSIYFKKMVGSMSNHTWFLNQLTSAAYIPVFGLTVLLTAAAGMLDPANSEFSKSKFLYMGFLDAFCGICMFVGGAFTSGTAQVMLSQATLPCTLAFSRLLLNKKYNIWQYGGSAVVLLGVVLGKISFSFVSSSIPSDGGPSLTGDKLIFNLIFVFASIPAALSYVYKEVAFHDSELDVNYMQFWVAAFQVLGGFVWAPLQALPILGPEKVSLSDMPSQLMNGCRCLFFRQNVFTTNCGGPGQQICDTCSSAWIFVSVYLFFNVLYNLFSLLVVKYSSAAVGYIVSTLRLPLSTFAFYLPLFMGSDVQSPKISDFVGLSVLVGGLGMYRFGSTEKRRKKQKHRNRTPPSSSPTRIQHAPLHAAHRDSNATHVSRRGLSQKISDLSVRLNLQFKSIRTRARPLRKYFARPTSSLSPGCDGLQNPFLSLGQSVDMRDENRLEDNNNNNYRRRSTSPARSSDVICWYQFVDPLNDLDSNVKRSTSGDSFYSSL